jgi:thiamine phosphate synthase YjbQ (UPF0047 family)
VISRRWRFHASIDVPMSSKACELTLLIRPRGRYDATDVNAAVESAHGDVLDAYRRVTYCSYHTTAGYLDQGLLARLGHTRERVDPFMRAFQRMFPSGADYRHDKIELRQDLSEAQRRTEPRNADSHLAYISAGLNNCATYVRRRHSPVYLIDLDGVGPAGSRERATTVVGFNREEVVERFERDLPLSGHAVDSLNLRDARLGLLEEVKDRARRLGIGRGRLDISLVPGERHAGLTVNEYETLLMQHDLPEVLRNPLHFMAQKARNVLRDPRSVPHKTLDYVSYDLIHVFNELMTALGVRESSFEKLLVRAISYPAARFLRLRRSISFLLLDSSGPVVLGRYQSPILIQWLPGPQQQRRLRLSLVRYD